MIEEYHLCNDCEYRIYVPTDPKFRSWEIACKHKRSEVNSSGGLTSCPVFKEDVRR